ncbi:right-handed parallel beta-helix repeat-containing protein [Candidatus Pacearchaeota archaeon]|nr:right-handed parallel beta-helix repeat-containing protein [Candidatus Pacearchaeota archaeon]
MKTKLLVIVSVLSVLFIATDRSYACGGGNQGPVADIIAQPEYIGVGMSVTLNGSSSYDPDGKITKYEWDFDYNEVSFTPDYNEIVSDYGDGIFDGITTHVYDTAEPHTAMLRVTDNGNATDTKRCTVHVRTIEIYYVDKSGSDDANGLSWDTAFVTIQKGVAEANYFDIVEVNEGTYYETIDFNGIYCTLTSVDSNDPCIVAATVIDGGSDDVNSVVTFDQSEDYAVLKGFTITGGEKGGMYCDGASPTINNCVIIDNNTIDYGGGMYIKESSPIVTNCFFVRNDANYGGGIYAFNSSPTITNCVFSDNIADVNGGGIYNNMSSLAIINCTFNGNVADDGGGIYNYESTLTMTNCVVWGNDANDGNSIYNYDVNCPTGNGLVGWWKFDKGDGSTVYDSSGNNNDGTISGAQWSTDGVNGALSFDGFNDYVSIPNSPELNITGDITISARIYFTRGGSGEGSEQAMVTKTVSNGAYNNPFDFRTGVGAEPPLRLVRADASGHECVYSTKLIPIKSWHHGLVRVENTVGDFYVDSVITGKTGGLTKNPTGNSNPLLIGKRADGLYFSGSLDDVRIYNRALSEDEIRALAICISYSNIEGCGGSSSWGPNFGVDGGGNIDDDPCFVNTSNPAGSDGIFGTLDDGLRLTSDSNCIDAADNDAINEGTDIAGDMRKIEDPYTVDTGNGVAPIVDIGAYEYDPNIVYVDLNATGNGDGSSWVNAYNKIQDAIDAAVAGQIVIVAEGTYYETIDFDDKAITVSGTDPNDPNVVAATIIDANDTSSGTYVVKFTGDNINSVLKGLTITGGNYGIYCGVITRAHIIACNIRNNAKYGIYSYYCWPTITNCTIEDNDSDGLYYRGCGSTNSATTNCIIANNGGNGVYYRESNPTMSGCTIRNNTKYGIEFYYGREGNVTNCTIKNNEDHGVYYYRGGESGIAYCIIKDNLGDGVNCYFPQQTVRITGSIIANNVGGGVISNPVSPVVTNCTVVGNDKGIVKGEEVTNCILWDNDDSDLEGCTSKYSCIEDGDLGIGNISIDPCFVNSDSNDFHLDSNSLCIDSGEPWADYSNEPTPNGNRINMGAYGNTSEAVTTTDADDDGISDVWERYYWPDDDPNQHEPNENLDGDSFSNWTEYLFGYDPSADDSSEPMLIPHAELSVPKFDPTQEETLTVEYWLNMDANVAVSFTDISTNEIVRVLEEIVTSGINNAVWDGKDSNGLIVEDGFYYIGIDGNDGDGNSTDFNAGTIEVDYEHEITSSGCSLRRIIPLNNEVVTIWYKSTVDANTVISIYDPCESFFRALTVLSEEPNEVIWDGRNGEPSDTNNRYMSVEGECRIEVRYEGMREKQDCTIMVYR